MTTKRPDWRRIELWLVVLIALHSVGVGVALIAFTDWSMAFGGWGRAEPRFFVRQAGVFHLVVAAGYLLEYLRFRGVGLLLLAKSAAVVFLLGVTWLGQEVVWAVPLSAVADGLMGAVALWIHRRARSAGQRPVAS